MRIEPFITDYLQGLVELFAVRGLHTSKSELSWKIKNPGYIGFCAFDDGGDMIAYYALLAVEIPGQEKKVAVAVDAITHPAQSSFGLIYDVMNSCFSRGRDSDTHLLLGVPNPEMARVLAYAGWKQLRKRVVCLNDSGCAGSDLIAGHNLSITNEYQRWRWEECPRQYNHLPGINQVVFAKRPGLFPAPMMLNSGLERINKVKEELSFCFLTPEADLPTRAMVIGEVPIYYYYLKETEKENEPDVLVDFSIIEALTLGW